MYKTTRVSSLNITKIYFQIHVEVATIQISSSPITQKLDLFSPLVSLQQAMVCVAGEGSVVCVVRDCSSRAGQPKSKLPVRPSTTVTDVFNHVAHHYSYDPDSFELVLQSARGEVVSLIIRTIDSM